MPKPIVDDDRAKAVYNLEEDNGTIHVTAPKKTPGELTTKLIQPKKITAMVHFGRSGTGLMHSLIDGHLDVSTLPSIYFSEFFDHFTWKKIIAGGWEEMVDRFATIYDILFDASFLEISISTIGFG